MWTADQVIQASDEWIWVPPGSERLRVHGVDVIDYPPWAHMDFHVMPRRVAVSAAALVDEVSRVASTRGRAASEWWISPSTEPRIERELRSRGAELTEEMDILARNLQGALPNVGTFEGRVVIVGDAETLDAAESVSAEVWGGEPSSGERRAEQLRHLGNPLDAEGGFRVVAYVDDEPASMGGCQVVRNVARMYGACTRDGLRGRGCYRAVIGKRLEVAVAHDATLALVQARTNTSGPILERLGFENYGHGRLYVLPTR